MVLLLPHLEHKSLSSASAPGYYSRPRAPHPPRSRCVNSRNSRPGSVPSPDALTCYPKHCPLRGVQHRAPVDLPFRSLVFRQIPGQGVSRSRRCRAGFLAEIILVGKIRRGRHRAAIGHVPGTLQRMTPKEKKKNHEPQNTPICSSISTAPSLAPN